MGLLRRIWGWIDDRTGLGVVYQATAAHPVPRNVGWWYVLGSATLTALIVEGATGIALATAYVSSTAGAYDSVQYITTTAPLGNIVRGMHYWGASAMVVLIVLHMCRVFMMGSYKFPREVNWLTGVVLLFCTLAIAFTGQVLRWDQSAVWGLAVAAEQAGRTPLVGGLLAHFILAGNTMGANTLSRMFAYHVFVFPALLLGTLGMHLYLVIRNGISEPPKGRHVVEPKTYRTYYRDLLARTAVPFWPDVAWRDVVAAFAVVLVIAVLAVVIGPPALDKLPDPTNLQAYPRPDWYFLFYFAVLALIPPQIESFVMIAAPLTVGIVLFALPFVANKGERNPLRRPWALAFVALSAGMFIMLTLSGQQASWSPDMTASPLTPTQVGSTQPSVTAGATVFHDKGCIDCHTMDGTGGQRGPDLSHVGSRMNTNDITIKIINGGTNMPAYGGNIAPQDLNNLVLFLQSRT